MTDDEKKPWTAPVLKIGRVCEGPGDDVGDDAPDDAPQDGDDPEPEARL